MNPRLSARRDRHAINRCRHLDREREERMAAVKADRLPAPPSPPRRHRPCVGGLVVVADHRMSRKIIAALADRLERQSTERAES